MRSIEAAARALGERLIALARRRSLRDPVAASCEQLGLTAPQVHALLWLGHDGPLTMGELARRVAVTEKTVTGRVVRARATARGAALSRTIVEGMHAKLALLLRLLEPADRDALHRILDKLLLRLGE